MTDFQSRVYTRHDHLDGVNTWHWIVGDTGTWDGPAREWLDLKEKVLSHCKHRRLIIQAGGAFGMYPRLWANEFKVVYTFEPSRLSFYVLNLNCAQENIFKFNAALHHQHGDLSLDESTQANMGCHSIRQDSQINMVPTMRIDDFQLEYLDALQLDIEGWEWNALQGAKETIQRCRPSVITLETVQTHTAAVLHQWGYEQRGRAGFDQLFVLKDK
jgi:FkbM family methyltransferase